MSTYLAAASVRLVASGEPTSPRRPERVALTERPGRCDPHRVNSWAQLVTSIASGIVSGGLVLAGVVVTQRRSDVWEGQGLDREQEREEARWRRQDAATLFTERRTAYADFVGEWQAQHNVAFDARKAREGLEVLQVPQLPPDFFEELTRRYLLVQMVGSKPADGAAVEALRELEFFASGGRADPLPRLDEFLAVARVDLGIVEGSIGDMRSGQ